MFYWLSNNNQTLSKETRRRDWRGRVWRNYTLFMPNLRNSYIHSDTYSWILELLDCKKDVHAHSRIFFGLFLCTYIINIAESEAAIGEAGGAQRPFCLLMCLLKTGAHSARGTWGKTPPVNKKQTDTLNIFKFKFLPAVNCIVHYRMHLLALCTEEVIPYCCIMMIISEHFNVNRTL